MEFYDSITREPIEADLTIALVHERRGSNLRESTDGEITFENEPVGVYALEVRENQSYQSAEEQNIRILPELETSIRLYLEPLVLPANGVLSGEVNNSATNEIVDVPLTIYLDSESTVFDSVRISSGSYRFETIPVGSYTLRVEGICGFEDFFSQNLTVERNTELRLDLPMEPTSRFIRRVTLNDFPETKPNGTLWDAENSNPDIYFTIATLGITSDRIDEVLQSDLPVTWEFTPFLYEGKSETWQFEFIDFDPISSDDPMAILTTNPLSNQTASCNQANQITIKFVGDGYDIELLYDIP